MPQPRTPTSPARRIGMVIVLPLLLALLGSWQVGRAANDAATLALEADDLAVQAGRMEAIAAVTPMRTVYFRGDSMGYGASLAASMMRDGVGVLHRGVLMARLREGLAAAVIAGGVASLVAGMAGLLAAAWAGRRSLVSRASLDAAFIRIRTLLPILLGTQIAGLTLACSAGLLFEVAGAWYGQAFYIGEAQALAIGMAAAGFVVWLGWLTLRELRRSLAAFTPTPMPLFGREVTADEAPVLWRVIRAASSGRQDAMPDHVVVGLVEGFFVTSSVVGLSPSRMLLSGRTLHIPLPALAMLDPAESSAVIAHELAHFVGEDVAYTQRFLPTYNGITRNLAALSAVNGAKAVRWTQAPAFTLGLHMLEVFDGAVTHWKREREIVADAASLAVSGADAVASALLRTGLIAAVVQGVLTETLRHPQAAPADLVAAAVAQAESEGLADPALLLQANEAQHGDHHPPTAQRIAALGVAQDAALLARAARLPSPGDMEAARTLFTDWGALCAAASHDAIGFATEARDERAARLRAFASEQPDGVTEVFQDLRRPTLTWSLGAFLCLAGFTVLTWRLQAGPIAEPENMPMLILVAAGLLVASMACFVRLVLLRRSGRTPFLTLFAEGFACRGLDRMVPWTGVRQINMTVNRAIYMFIHLLPITPLPVRVSGWAVRVGRRRPVVSLMGVRPRGMTPRAYLELIHRYWNAARAKAALELMEGGPDAQPPAYTAIVTQEQLEAMMAQGDEHRSNTRDQSDADPVTRSSAKRSTSS